VVQSTSDLDRFIEEALSGDIRRLDGEQRRVRILAAAIQECSQKDFRTASMAGIALRARVSTASLYRDFGTREHLLDQAALLAAPLVASELTVQVTETRPRERLIALLIRHCAVFDHPHASWLYRAHVSGALQESSELLKFAKLARENIESFWRHELTTLHGDGVLKVTNMNEAVNFILGAVQRRTLLALLLFGADDVAEPDLETAATSAVDWLFTQFGTNTFRKAPSR
jgi:AcrR family transcriptional regulator